MKILIDLNLSPRWVAVFQESGWECVHWSAVGDVRATDETLMTWARERDYVVFTHDLDFGIILALTRAGSPSVIQIRAQNILPEVIGKRMISILRQHEKLLEQGALLTIDEQKSRIRILPLQRS